MAAVISICEYAFLVVINVVGSGTKHMFLAIYRLTEIYYNLPIKTSSVIRLFVDYRISTCVI